MGLALALSLAGPFLILQTNGDVKLLQVSYLNFPDRIEREENE